MPANHVDHVDRALKRLKPICDQLEAEGVADAYIGAALLVRAQLYLEDVREEHMRALRPLLVQTQERVTALLMRHDK
jgi:hypothetical protein